MIVKLVPQLLSSRGALQLSATADLFYLVTFSKSNKTSKDVPTSDDTGL
jgi:hypothetical protein